MAFKLRFKLLTRRTIPWPTLPGWIGLLLFGVTPILLWWAHGESFLCHTERIPAQVLVVEGWISAEGIRAAKAEYVQGNYAYIVPTGGLSGEKWESRRWSYAAEAEEQLLRSGIPRERVILAVPQDTEVQRTFASAQAVQRALNARGIESAALNLFTRGAHARRSRLVYAKVFSPATQVGVIAWLPPGFASAPWWQSSERANDLLKETAGYWFELLLNSGRRSNTDKLGKS